MEFGGIDWDDGNWPKCGRHGLSKEEIESFLREGTTRILSDRQHSAGEDRLLAIGRDVRGRAGIFVGFTIRMIGERMLVRPITARYMHAKEIARYDSKQD